MCSQKRMYDICQEMGEGVLSRGCMIYAERWEGVCVA